MIRAIVAVGVLTLIWLLLWERWTPGTVLGGVVVSIVVFRGARLRPGRALGRVHPVDAAKALADIVRQLVLSSLAVAAHVVRHPGDPAAAVVAVDVRAESEAEIALAAAVVSLTPGTMAVGFDPGRRRLVVHGMPVHDRSEVERLRGQVSATERRLDRAFGERHERNAES